MAIFSVFLAATCVAVASASCHEPSPAFAVPQWKEVCTAALSNLPFQRESLTDLLRSPAHGSHKQNSMASMNSWPQLARVFSTARRTLSK
jgi:hypothetical protein